MTQTAPTGYQKPLPSMRGYTKEFYDWSKKHELRFQRCLKCGVWRHVPRPMCPECHSFEWEWAKSSGRGKLLTWIVPYQSRLRGFSSDIPYLAAMVKLEEGPGVMTTVTDIKPEDLKVEMELDVWFDDVTPEVTLPKFRPASRGRA